MKEKNKSIWSKWYMIVIYCVFGFIILVSIIPSNDNTTNVQTTSTLPNTYEYLDDMSKLLDIMIDLSYQSSDILTEYINGKLSNKEVSVLFYMISDVQKEMVIGLENMNVPEQYKIYHQHVINAVKYNEEASYLTIRAYSNDNIDFELFDKATNKYNMATVEMDLATASL